MTVEHRDISGLFIKPGDYIIYAALWSRSAILKYGRVTRLADRPEAFIRDRETGKTPTLRLISADRVSHGEWVNGTPESGEYRRWYAWELQRQGKETTLGLMDRLMVVSPTQVPEEARTLLDGAWEAKAQG